MDIGGLHPRNTVYILYKMNLVVVPILMGIKQIPNKNIPIEWALKSPGGIDGRSLCGGRFSASSRLALAHRAGLETP